MPYLYTKSQSHKLPVASGGVVPFGFGPNTYRASAGPVSSPKINSINNLLKLFIAGARQHLADLSRSRNRLTLVILILVTVSNLHQACSSSTIKAKVINQIKNLLKPLIARAAKMVRKGFQEAKTGIEYLKSVNYDKYLRKVGLGREDWYFWKQVGKALLCSYTLIGIAWVYNETSPLGWWTLKPRPKEERELAHLYERREFPYPGDAEAMEEFIAKGGMIGTTIGPKGVTETDKDAYNYQKELQDKKFEQEAQKLWARMRNEVVQELQEKGYDVE